MKTFWLILTAVLGLSPIPANGQQQVNVVILPFEIFAQKELSYLQSDLPAALKTSLEQAGARVLLLDAVSEPEWRQRVSNLGEIKKLSQQTGAEYIIWGTLTWIGQQFSLDLKLFESLDGKAPSLFTSEGRGIENLPSALEKLAQSVNFKIFKRKQVLAVEVTGNQRIEIDAIKRVVKTQPGDIYNLKSLSEDLKAIYAMGYFDDIRVETEALPDGNKVTFKVKEKPTLRSVRISGNVWVFDNEEIKEVVTAKRGSILNVNVIQNDMSRIEDLYKEKNYHNVRVDYKIFESKDNQADLEFIIDEGAKFQIEKIEFEGNKAFSDKKLKRQMITSETSILSWITEAGDLDEDNLEQDVARLKAFYHNSGYIQAQVGEPQVEFKENDIIITIKIDEGEPFKVGKVTFAGDLILTEKELLKDIKITQEEFYNREVLRTDILALTDLYADEGYAFADVAPMIKRIPEELKVDITFNIEKGKPVYYEEIIISGNTKTRDRVIRRQLRVYEQELTSAARLKRSVTNLNRLDYFEDVNVSTAKGSAADKMVLKIDVTEKSTGAFSFGGGYGNAESFFGTAQISERNLFGRGQTLALQGVIGGQTQKIQLSFTEPYIYDIPLSGTISLYNWIYDYNDYEKDSVGGNIGFGYPVFDYTRFSVSYTYDLSDIGNIDDSASDSIKELKGENIKSSITSNLKYDSRNRRFLATRGALNSLSFEFAGLGGDIGFTKYIAETGWYVPLVWDFVGVAHAKAGYVADIKKKILPDYEKFYMGGIRSLRGFERDDLAPKDDEGASVGGDAFVQFNFEVVFPLLKDIGVHGLVFFDAGRIYKERDDIEFNPSDLRTSAGGGIRWLSPMGPLDIEYGYILDQKDTDHGPGNFEFSMASSF
ncbi:MAG: outer membrane protein assembly factor BamA [Desulfobacterales bacterium]|jgi:outer membrane protein insertion porin family